MKKMILVALIPFLSMFTACPFGGGSEGGEEAAAVLALVAPAPTTTTTSGGETSGETSTLKDFVQCDDATNSTNKDYCYRASTATLTGVKYDTVNSRIIIPKSGNLLGSQQIADVSGSYAQCSLSGTTAYDSTNAYMNVVPSGCIDIRFNVYHQTTTQVDFRFYIK